MRAFPKTKREQLGIKDSLIRMSVGIEAIEDLKQIWRKRRP